MSFHCRLLLLSLALFIAGGWLYSRHIHFPHYYHADEPGKVRQIIKGERNFHHPLLMVNTVAAAVNLTGTPLRSQPVVEAGRWFSVVASALAVALLAWFAGRMRGLAVAAAAGVFLLLQQDVFELAHYFKEDPALLCGTVLTFVALAWLARGGGEWSVVMLGMAAALAFSAKYVGIVLLPLALGFAWKRGGVRAAGVCTAAFVAVALLVNAQMITQREEAKASFERETKLVAGGQTEVQRSVPHSGFVQRFVRRVKPPLGLFYAWGLYVWWSRRKKTADQPPGADVGCVSLARAVESAMVLFPFAFTLMLSFSAKDSGRYFHPCLAGICYTAGLGLADLVSRLWVGSLLTSRSNALRRALAICSIFAALAGALWPVAVDWRGFQNDARGEMMNFIREKVPVNAVILVGRRVDLPEARNARVLDPEDLPRLPQELRFTEYTADAGGIDALKQQGVGYLAMAEDEYGRYIDPEAKPKGRDRDLFEKRRQFYRDLFSRGRLLLDIPAGPIGTHNPPLRLVQLP